MPMPDELAKRKAVEQIQAEIAALKAEFGNLATLIDPKMKALLKKRKEAFKRAQQAFESLQRKLDPELKLLKQEVFLLKYPPHKKRK